MSNPFRINCQWLGPANSGDDASADACRAAIEIAVGDLVLTRLDDLMGNTVRNQVFADACTLGKWVAGNWWRLCREPATPHSPPDPDWRMSHSMASAGDGFSWPGIAFATDGEVVEITSRSSPTNVMGSVRYLTDASESIPLADFERGIDRFMEQVLTRLHSEGCANTELSCLWQEILHERADKELSKWRRLEAICGYDPDEAPGNLIQSLIEDPSGLGQNALEEVAAHSRHRTPQALAQIQSLDSMSIPTNDSGGFRCQPMTLAKKPKYHSNLRPWEKATVLAKAARKEWGLSDGPVSNMHLASVLKTSKAAFKDHSNKSATPMPLALKKHKGDKMDVFIGSSWGTTRRFSATRILGDWLDQPGSEERLIPAGEARTVSQQFQRAFAQEFLCPYETLLSRIQTEDPDDDNILDAANYFGVSPMVVRSTLVNKGRLGREALIPIK